MSTKRPLAPPAKPPALCRERVAPPSDDEDDYVPARSAKKMPSVFNKRVKVSSAIPTASNLVDDATNRDYPNVQTLNDLINERGMMLRPDAVSMWTPTAGRLPHVTELEPVDGRSWEVTKVLEHHVTGGDDVLPV
ncbi:hypothetical protein KCU67_g1823, partial [Aureobasidium melanogenum]